ncbi:hypothetical protein US8_01678 [Bacillus altitudinis]|nr:hypothetical protein US8_01678 [Bacillus altitudinis]
MIHKFFLINHDDITFAFISFILLGNRRLKKPAAALGSIRL